MAHRHHGRGADRANTLVWAWSAFSTVVKSHGSLEEVHIGSTEESLAERMRAFWWCHGQERSCIASRNRLSVCSRGCTEDRLQQAR